MKTFQGTNNTQATVKTFLDLSEKEIFNNEVNHEH